MRTMNYTKSFENMRKADFIKLWNTDFVFRNFAKNKGINVIQNNVIFFNADGSVKAIAGAYIK